MRGLRIIVVIEAAMLVLAVGLVLHSEGKKRFPPTVAVTTALVPRHAVLPVSVDLGFRGSTRTSAVVFLTRGGRATAARARGNARRGVGFGRTAGKSAGRPG
ncbi:MAG TPA: hypothetical protein VK546_03880 [Gaiellales bacterium]|nr:hypothetical protein [Gaiellales bacterium]